MSLEQPSPADYALDHPSPLFEHPLVSRPCSRLSTDQMSAFSSPAFPAHSSHHVNLPHPNKPILIEQYSNGAISVGSASQGAPSSTHEDFADLFSPLKYVNMEDINSSDSLSPTRLNQALINDTLAEFPNLSGFMQTAADEEPGLSPPTHPHPLPNIISIGSTESQDVIIAYEVDSKGLSSLYPFTWKFSLKLKISLRINESKRREHIR